MRLLKAEKGEIYHVINKDGAYVLCNVSKKIASAFIAKNKKKEAKK